LLRCTKQLETRENWENRIYAANIGLGQIVDEDEDASPECLSFELFPGATTADIMNCIKDYAKSGEQLCSVLDFSDGEAVLAIEYSGDNFPDPTDDCQLFPNAWAIVTETCTIVYTEVSVDYYDD